MKTQQASENARLALGSLLMVFTGNWAGQEHLSTLAYSFAVLERESAMILTEAEAREKACCRDAAPGPNGRWKILPTNYGMSALKDNRQ